MNKKTKIIVSIVVAFGALLTVIRNALMSESYINYSSQIKHFWDSGTEYITDLTAEEQAELLTAFNVVIPAEETEAYISAFGKYESEEYLHFYVIEFDSVNSYKAFYRIGENGLTGLSDNQSLALTDNQLENGYFSEPTDGKTDYYLTYTESVDLRFNEDKLHIAELYEEYLRKRG